MLQKNNSTFTFVMTIWNNTKIAQAMPHNKLKNIRLEANLTQQQMADLLCMTQSSYSKIESGKNGLSTDVLIRVVMQFKEKAENILYSSEHPILLQLENSSIK